MQSLFEDMGMRLSFDTDIIDMYRVGKAAANRPLIIKLSKFETKNHILQQAKNLKGNMKWHGVGITHDLTKIEYAEEKFRECHLRLEAENRNNWLSSDEKKLKFWKVVGGRGKRHLTLYHLSTCNYGNNSNSNRSSNNYSDVMEMKLEKENEEAVDKKEEEVEKEKREEEMQVKVEKEMREEEEVDEVEEDEEGEDEEEDKDDDYGCDDEEKAFYDFAYAHGFLGCMECGGLGECEYECELRIDSLKNQ